MANASAMRLRPTNTLNCLARQIEPICRQFFKPLYQSLATDQHIRQIIGKTGDGGEIASQIFNLTPRGKIEDLGRNLSSIARFANDLPNVLIRGERLVERLEKLAADGFDLSGQTVERIGRAEAHRARIGHAALWVIAILLALGLWLR